MGGGCRERGRSQGRGVEGGGRGREEGRGRAETGKPTGFDLKETVLLY